MNLITEQQFQDQSLEELQKQQSESIKKLSLNYYQRKQLQDQKLQDMEQELLKKISLKIKQLQDQKREGLLKTTLLACLDDQHYQNFIESIEEIEPLIKLSIEEKHLKQKLNKILVVNVITSMETYLANTFINTMINGKDKQGNMLEITNEEILNLIALVKGFVKDIEQKINFSNLSEEERYPLRGSVTHYEAPTEPVAMEDWDVLK